MNYIQFDEDGMLRTNNEMDPEALDAFNQVINYRPGTFSNMYRDQQSAFHAWATNRVNEEVAKKLKD